MAIARHHQTSVGTSATAIEGTQYPGYLLKNNGAAVVYLGDSSVTTGTGFPIDPGDVFSPVDMANKSVRGYNSERLYGIVASGTVDVRVLLQPRVNV